MKLAVLRAGLLGAGLLCVPAPGQAQLYIDPVYGLDQVGGGSPTRPFKTLSFATSQWTSQTLVTFNLRPGVYSVASGEVYPIVLPDLCEVIADPAVTVPGDRSVEVTSPLSVGTTFLIAPARTTSILFRDLLMTGGHLRAVEIAQLGQQSLVRIERCEILQARGLVARVAGDGTLNLRVRDSSVIGSDSPISISAVGSTFARIEIDRSVVSGGITSAIRLSASQGGLLTSFVRGSRVHGGRLQGALAESYQGGIVWTRFESSTLHEIGTGVTNGGSDVGAIVDRVGPSGLPPNHQIYNCLFDNNFADAPGANPAAYSFGVNLVGQQSLVGMGSNIMGQATFVDDSRGDFHLARGSLGIDLGNAADLTMWLDLDGDPRGTLIALNPDLGHDEYYDDYLYAPEPPRVGNIFHILLTTEPARTFGLVVSTQAVGGSFGAGKIHLSGVPIATALIGSGNGRGIGDVSFTVPAEASLAGLEVYWQAVVAASPYLGSNACRTVVLP